MLTSILLLPTSFRSKSHRRCAASAGAGTSTTQQFRRLPRISRAFLDLHPSLPLVPGVLALRENLSAYDASYVALAAALGCSLLTYDRRLVRAAGAHCAVELAP